MYIRNDRNRITNRSYHTGFQFTCISKSSARAPPVFDALAFVIVVVVSEEKFLGCICLQYISMMYLGNLSPSLIMDSHLGFAKTNPCMIEVALPIDTSSIISSTTFNSLSSSPEADFQQQQLEHAPQHSSAISNIILVYY